MCSVPAVASILNYFFIKVIDYMMKYLTSTAVLQTKIYCALSSIVYTKIKMDNFALLDKYLPVSDWHVYSVRI